MNYVSYVKSVIVLLALIFAAGPFFSHYPPDHKRHQRWHHYGVRTIIAMYELASWGAHSLFYEDGPIEKPDRKHKKKEIDHKRKKDHKGKEEVEEPDSDDTEADESSSDLSDKIKSAFNDEEESVKTIRRYISLYKIVLSHLKAKHYVKQSDMVADIQRIKEKAQPPLGKHEKFAAIASTVIFGKDGTVDNKKDVDEETAKNVETLLAGLEGALE